MIKEEERIGEHVKMMRDSFRMIDAITKELEFNPKQEAVNQVLKKREVLVAEINNLASELAAYSSEWRVQAHNNVTIAALLNEAEELMRSIFHRDEKLDLFIKKGMNHIETKLIGLYHTSQAAHSYTVHSTLRIAR